MTVKEMNRYMRLVNRLMWIMDHSGVSWQPEYADEAEPEGIKRASADHRGGP